MVLVDSALVEVVCVVASEVVVEEGLVVTSTWLGWLCSELVDDCEVVSAIEGDPDAVDDVWDGLQVVSE